MSCVTKEIGVVVEEQTLVRHIGTRHALPRTAAVLKSTEDPFHLESCTNFESEVKGCGSCMGKRACYDVGSDVKIGDNSCTSGDQSCARASGNSVIWNDSCNGKQACQRVNDVTIGPNSCKAAPDGSGYLAGFRMEGSAVGSNSCNGSDASCSRLQSSTAGDASCQEAGSCYANCGIGPTASCGVQLTIGSNSCNYDSICSFCENDSVIPDNACNDPFWKIGSDATDIPGSDHPGGWCNYCIVSSVFYVFYVQNASSRCFCLHQIYILSRD